MNLGVACVHLYGNKWKTELWHEVLMPQFPLVSFGGILLELVR